MASRWDGRNLREPKQVVFVGKELERSEVFLSSAGPTWSALENAVRAAEHRGKGETVELVGRESQEKTTAMKSLRLNEAQCERADALVKKWARLLKAKSRPSMPCGFAAARIVAKNQKEEEMVVPDDAREPVSLSGMEKGDFGCRRPLTNGTMCQREPCAGARRWFLRGASQGTPDKPKTPQPQGEENGKGKGKGAPGSAKKNLGEDMEGEGRDDGGKRGRSQGRRSEPRRSEPRRNSPRRKGRSKTPMAGRRRSRHAKADKAEGATCKPRHITPHHTYHPAPS